MHMNTNMKTSRNVQQAVASAIDNKEVNDFCYKYDLYLKAKSDPGAQAEQTLQLRQEVIEVLARLKQACVYIADSKPYGKAVVALSSDRFQTFLTEMKVSNDPDVDYPDYNTTLYKILDKSSSKSEILTSVFNVTTPSNIIYSIMPLLSRDAYDAYFEFVNNVCSYEYRRYVESTLVARETQSTSGYDTDSTKTATSILKSLYAVHPENDAIWRCNEDTTENKHLAYGFISTMSRNDLCYEDTRTLVQAFRGALHASVLACSYLEVYDAVSKWASGIAGIKQNVDVTIYQDIGDDQDTSTIPTRSAESSISAMMESLISDADKSSYTCLSVDLATFLDLMVEAEVSPIKVKVWLENSANKPLFDIFPTGSKERKKVADFLKLPKLPLDVFYQSAFILNEEDIAARFGENLLKLV